MMALSIDGGIGESEQSRIKNLSIVHQHDDSFHVACFSSIIVAASFFLWRWMGLAKKEMTRYTVSAVAEGTMISHEVPKVREALCEKASRRAADLTSHQISTRSDRLASQVGGLSDHKRPVLKLEPDYILKPVRLDHRGIREIGFYEAVSAATDSFLAYSDFAFLTRNMPSKNGVLSRFASLIGDTFGDISCIQSEKEVAKLLQHEANILRRLDSMGIIPNYFGVVSHGDCTSSITDKDSYLVLQDETNSFSKPCTLDIKIGTQTYEPDATDEKKIRERKKYPAQLEFGFRIVGFRVYDPLNQAACEDGFVFRSKTVGRSLATFDDVKTALIQYLSPSISNSAGDALNLSAAALIMSSLGPVLQWFLENKSLRFCASSLLIVYEGDRKAVDSSNKVVVKLIDFARVRRVIGGDPGCLLGVQTIISLFEDILREHR